MVIRTYKDVGAVIRHYRRQRGLDQLTLAKNIGVSRQWIVEVEKGKARAAVGLVLRALDALGVPLTTSENATEVPKAGTPSDIDAIVEKARRRES